MFLVEVGKLIKKGLRSSYISTQDNSKFYRGKLLVSKNINSNTVHKERFFVEYDDFNKNRPENRLIKTTMLYLKSKTHSNNIKSLINKYVFAFDDIDASKNIIDDFNKCLKNRTMSDYDIIIKWCNIFLSNNSFTNFKGNSETVSLLFPMEKVFESYIAKKIKESIWFKEYSIKTQDNKYYLIENPKKFSLRPDIVIEKNGIVTILDTKWKLLNSEEGKNSGISQSDLYQMYAYAKKYESNNIVLIYPISAYVKNFDKNIEFIYEDNIKLNIYFVDLENIEDSMKKLYEIIAL
jgi:5-methylcytosine-specific restriction enzyme subunit McrC